jgi:hypothetical protein
LVRKSIPEALSLRIEPLLIIRILDRHQTQGSLIERRSSRLGDDDADSDRFSIYHTLNIRFLRVIFSQYLHIDNKASKDKLNSYLDCIIFSNNTQHQYELVI